MLWNCLIHCREKQKILVFSFGRRKEASQSPCLASPQLCHFFFFFFSFFFHFFFLFFFSLSVYYHHDEFTYYATIIIAIPPIKQYLPHLPQTATTPSMTAALPYSSFSNAACLESRNLASPPPFSRRCCCCWSCLLCRSLFSSSEDNSRLVMTGLLLLFRLPGCWCCCSCSRGVSSKSAAGSSLFFVISARLYFSLWFTCHIIIITISTSPRM